MNLRSILKSAVASTLAATRADCLVSRLQVGRHAPVVLGYHRIVDDFDAHAGSSIPAMLTSRAMLEQHLDWLSTRFRFVSLDQIGDRVQSGRGFDEPVAAITFDDGYRDMCEQAVPLLTRRGIPSAVFVATEFVSGQAPLAHDRLYLLVRHALTTERGRKALADVGRAYPLHRRPTRTDVKGGQAYVVTTGLLGRLPRRAVDEVLAQLESVLGVTQSRPTAPALTWDMLARMRDQGVTIGFHTHRHAVLTSETPEQMSDELCTSRQLLERRLGIPICHFAYPDGRFNRSVVRAVAQAGAPFAYTTCRHQDPLFPALTIPRRLLWEKSCVGPRGAFSPSILSGHVHGVFEYANGCVEDHAADHPVVTPHPSVDESSRCVLARQV